MSDQQKKSAILSVLLVIALAVVTWFALTAVQNNPAPQPVPANPNPIEIEGNKAAAKDPTSAEQAAATMGVKQPDGTLDFGWRPNPQSTKAFLATLNKPFLSQAGPDLLAKAKSDQPILLYRSLYKAHAATHGGEQWLVGRQGIGDCVSWGWVHGVDTHLSVLWELGEVTDWKPAATESIYGGSRVEARGVTRGGWSDGSYGSAAAKWVKGWGIVHRQPYDGVDLSKYDASRAKDWGNYGNGGSDDDGKLDAIAKKYPVKGVALCRTFTEAAAAIESGYPVPVCSGRGFTSTRDKDGFAAPRGSWAHCMCFIAVRYDRPGLLCLNSWGPSWISGPKWPEDMPDGSFWVDASVVDGMLAGGDSFAVSGYEGFPHRDLRHGDWAKVKPPSKHPPSRRQVDLVRYEVAP